MNDKSLGAYRLAVTSLLQESVGLTGTATALWLSSLSLLWWRCAQVPDGSAIVTGLLGGIVLAGLAAGYFGFRLRIDARLFALLEVPAAVPRTDFAEAIAALRRNLWRPQIASNWLEARLGGALCLWRCFIAAILIEVALSVVATAMAAAGLAAA
jgi:hypothetical protein